MGEFSKQRQRDGVYMEGQATLKTTVQRLLRPMNDGRSTTSLPKDHSWSSHPPMEDKEALIGELKHTLQIAVKLLDTVGNIRIPKALGEGVTDGVITTTVALLRVID